MRLRIMIYHASNYRVCDYYCSKYYSSVITVDLITIQPARVELVNTLYTADETQLQSVYDSDDHRACTRGTRQYIVYSSDHRILVPNTTITSTNTEDLFGNPIETSSSLKKLISSKIFNMKANVKKTKTVLIKVNKNCLLI